MTPRRNEQFVIRGKYHIGINNSGIVAYLYIGRLKFSEYTEKVRIHLLNAIINAKAKNKWRQ